MKALDLMTSDPSTVTPRDSLTRAADIMRRIGVGAVPVVDSEATRTLVGIVTDRDIAIRCAANAHGAGCRVDRHMTPLPLWTALPGDDEYDVLQKMEKAQVRRILVVDTKGRLLGIIAQADIARKLGPRQPKTVDELLELVSAPACEVEPTAAV